MYSNAFLTIVVSAIFLFARVESDCMQTLVQYYQCKNMTSPLINFPAELSAITTFNGAMEKFKSIYTELDWNTCSSSLCQCVKQNPVLSMMNYGAFFVNSGYYADMVSILTAVRNKYTRMNLYASSLMELNMSMPLTMMNNSLMQFCSNYEFSMADLYSYAEAVKCMSKMSMGALTCVPFVSNGTTNMTDFSINTNGIQNFLKCTSEMTYSCDVEIRRDLIYNILSYAPSVIGQNGLLNYVNSIIESADAEAKNVTVVWATGDPHISSVMKGFETCNFDISLVCIQSDNVQVNCTGIPFSNMTSVTTLSEVKITFTKGGVSNTFIADQSTFPMTFSNGQTTVKDASGNDWLQMTAFSAQNFIVITDKNSGMVLSVGKFSTFYFLIAQAPKSAYKPGGILTDGCPIQFKGATLTAARRKRATSNAATVCASSTSQNSNSLISTNDLYKGCVSDVVATGDSSFADMYQKTISASSEVKSAYTSAFGAGTQLRATFSYLILAIGFFLYKFF